MAEAAQRSGDEDRVPRLAPGWEGRGARLSPQEGFLLSRIDGVTSWALLRRIAGLPPEQVDDTLERWVEEGLVIVEGSAARGRTAPRAAAGAVDGSLDLPVELQQKIIDFEKRLDRSYHEILGISRDADAKAVKRAYFKLSKDFHPDRYFGREIGAFAARLDRIFKKVALAYELLMDPTTRAELERSMGAGPPASAAPRPAPSPGGPRPPQTLDKREWLDRLRQRFRIPEPVLAERRLRARQLGEAARVAQHQKRWSEAASSIRLAIAFDPWSEALKDQFGEIQAEVHRERAERLLEEAGALDSRSAQQALRLYDEVLHYRPRDAKAFAAAARVALEAGEGERAQEYAERACEIEPAVAAHALTLARALRRQGRQIEAKQAFEKARSIDPNDAGVLEELKRQRRKPGRG